VSPLARTSDIELLRAHVGGDREAFSELVVRHRDRMWAVAIRVLGDRQEAEDAVQDAFLAALRGAAGFRGEAAVTTWLHRITLNAALDRARRRKPTVPLDPTDAGLPSRVVAVPAESDRIPDAMDVTRALSQLSPDAREVLLLVDVEGRPVAEVADKLGVAIGTVKSRCFRARARMAVLLGVIREPGDAAHRTAGSPGSLGNPAPPPHVTGTDAVDDAGGER
jgi:RNA polymerase sigma-70 factor (ECF subfamily)